jgi:hypothetical protein
LPLSLLLLRIFLEFSRFFEPRKLFFPMIVTLFCYLLSIRDFLRNFPKFPRAFLNDYVSWPATNTSHGRGASQPKTVGLIPSIPWAQDNGLLVWHNVIWILLHKQTWSPNQITKAAELSFFELQEPWSHL